MLPTIARDLAAIVGPKHVRAARAERITYAMDGLPTHRRVPDLVVLPGTREELIAVVRLLAALGVAFVPRGAGTGLSGGALADERSVLLVLTRLNRILRIDRDNRLAVVEPGVVNAKLGAAARPAGLQYAPDPSSQSACTIGGNVAENAGGPHCLKYGVTVNHILALEVLLADGSLVEIGSPSGESWGPDLVGVFVGSEGNFGIATRITVRLTPLPRAVRTLLADFTGLRTAGEAVSAIIATGIVPAALEMMDQSCINAVEDSVYAAGYPRDAAAVLLVEIGGDRGGARAAVAGPQESIRRDGSAVARPRRTGCRRSALRPAAGPRNDCRDRGALRPRREQRLPRGRRQSPSQHLVRRDRSGSQEQGRSGERRDHAGVYCRRRDDYRRARRGYRQVDRKSTRL